MLRYHKHHKAVQLIRKCFSSENSTGFHADGEFEALNKIADLIDEKYKNNAKFAKIAEMYTKNVGHFSYLEFHFGVYSRIDIFRHESRFSGKRTNEKSHA